jgi:hypothetical protein
VSVPTPAKRPRGVTKATRRRFLDALGEGYSITHAAKLAGRDRRRFYALAEDDPEFAEEMRTATEAGIDTIEDELRAAASEGWLEVDETIEGGEVVRRVERHRKDPRLLARLREWRRPPEAQPLVHVDARPVMARPVDWSDIAGMLRETGQMHLIGSFHPALVRAMLPQLAPAELEAVAAEVVDVEPGADIDPDSSESLNPLPVQVSHASETTTRGGFQKASDTMDAASEIPSPTPLESSSDSDVERSGADWGPP